MGNAFVSMTKCFLDTTKAYIGYVTLSLQLNCFFLYFLWFYVFVQFSFTEYFLSSLVEVLHLRQAVLNTQACEPVSLWACEPALIVLACIEMVIYSAMSWWVWPGWPWSGWAGLGVRMGKVGVGVGHPAAAPASSWRAPWELQWLGLLNVDINLVMNWW